MMDTLFFYVAKLVWILIRPESWLVLALGVALVLLMRGCLGAGRRWLGGVLLCLFVLGWLPLGDLLLRPMETRIALIEPESVDGILILGGPENGLLSGYWNQPQLSGGAERLTVGAALAHRFPEAPVLFTGGSGALVNHAQPGADVARDVLIGLGVAPERLILERAARNTSENARLSKAMVPDAPTQTWVLVTSAYHMPRSVGIFCAQGWPVHPYPVDYRSGPFVERIRWNLALHLRDLNTGFREWVGLVAYYVTGRSASLWPEKGNC